MPNEIPITDAVRSLTFPASPINPADGEKENQWFDTKARELALAELLENGTFNSKYDTGITARVIQELKREDKLKAGKLPKIPFREKVEGQVMQTAKNVKKIFTRKAGQEKGYVTQPATYTLFEKKHSRSISGGRPERMKPSVSYEVYTYQKKSFKRTAAAMTMLTIIAGGCPQTAVNEDRKKQELKIVKEMHNERAR